jgi:hypothetical protein
MQCAADYNCSTVLPYCNDWRMTLRLSLSRGRRTSRSLRLSLYALCGTLQLYCTQCEAVLKNEADLPTLFWPYLLYYLRANENTEELPETNEELTNNDVVKSG